jgi:hypothetical protein
VFRFKVNRSARRARPLQGHTSAASRGKCYPPQDRLPGTRNNSTTWRRPEAFMQCAVRPHCRARAAARPASPRYRSSQGGGRRPIPSPALDRALDLRTGAISQREESLAGKAGAAEEHAHLRKRERRPTRGDPRGVADDREPAVPVTTRAMHRQTAQAGASRQKGRSCARPWRVIPVRVRLYFMSGNPAS